MKFVRQDLTGQKFGRLLAVSFSHKSVHSESMWNCKCDCGGSAIVSLSHLRHGATKSCGCILREILKKRMTGKMQSYNLGFMKPSNGPTEHPTIKDIYWAAGIYEGEGTSYYGTTIVAKVSQKDTWILEKLRDLFGGATNSRKRRNCSEWALSGPRARGFLMTIYTLLSPRRQAQIKGVFAASGHGRAYEFSL